MQFSKRKKKKNTFTLNKIQFILLGALIVLLSSYTYLLPVIMWGRTGSPGESTCVACHNSFPLNSGGGFIKIKTIPSLINNKYMPGQTYTMNLVVFKSGNTNFTFDFEALDSLSINTGTSTITDSVHTRLLTYAFNGRQNVFYNAEGIALDSFVFSFNWKAPLNGEVNFYAVGNVPNIDGETPGDYIYSDAIVNIKPFSTAGIFDLVENKKNKVYPNPSSGNVIIDYKTKMNQPISIQLFDNSGKEISNENKVKQISAFSIQYYLPAEIANGTYFLRINSSGYQETNKIIIEK